MSVYRGTLQKKNGKVVARKGMKLMDCPIPAATCVAVHVVILDPVAILDKVLFEFKANNMSMIQQLDAHTDNVLYEVPQSLLSFKVG